MRPDDLGGNRQAEPGASRTHRPLEGAEQVGAGPHRHAGARIRDLDLHRVAMPFAADRETAHDRRTGVGLQRLDGVSAEVEKDAEELVRVGVDLQIVRHSVHKIDGHTPR